MMRSTLLKVSSNVSHVGVKLATVRPEPAEFASHPPVADRAGRKSDLIRHLVEREGEPAVLLGQEGDAPEGHGAALQCCSRRISACTSTLGRFLIAAATRRPISVADSSPMRSPSIITAC